MAWKVRDAGTTRAPTKLTIGQGGINRRIRTLKTMDGGVLRTVATFADPLSLSVAPSTTTGFSDGGGIQSIETEPAFATPSGGFGPFTYAWAYVSGDTAKINSPSLASTTFTRSVGNGATDTGVFRCTVTDSLGNTATADVTARFINSGA